MYDVSASHCRRGLGSLSYSETDLGNRLYCGDVEHTISRLRRGPYPIEQTLVGKLRFIFREESRACFRKPLKPTTVGCDTAASMSLWSRRAMDRGAPHLH